MPIVFDGLTFDVSQTGQTITVGQAIVGSKAAYLPPTLYVGMIVANSWTASASVTAGSSYVTSANPNVFASTNRRIFVCSGTGTTGTSEPAWNQFPGSVTTDGSAQWTEASTQFSGTRNVYDTPSFANTEPTDAAYPRAVQANEYFMVGDTVNPTPTLTWPTSTEAWGSVAGLFISDAASGGNCWAWGVLPTLYSVSASGVTPVFPLPITPSSLAGTSTPPVSGAVALVQSAVTNFNTTLTSGARTVALSGVMSGDTLVLAVPLNGVGLQSVSSVTSTGSPSWSKVNSKAGANDTDIEWWYATGVPAGTNTVSVTPTGSSSFGIWLGELSGAGTPVSGMTATATSVSVAYTAMTVGSPGSWVAIASNSASAESNSVGLGTFNAGPTISGNQFAGLTYGATSADTPAATGWMGAGSDPWVTAGIVVPPA